MQYLNLVFRFPQRNQTQFSQPISDHGYLALCDSCLSAKDSVHLKANILFMIFLLILDSEYPLALLGNSHNNAAIYNCLYSAQIWNNSCANAYFGFTLRCDK